MCVRFNTCAVLNQIFLQCHVSQGKNEISYIVGPSAHQHHSKQDQRNYEHWPSHGCSRSSYIKSSEVTTDTPMSL